MNKPVIGVLCASGTTGKPTVNNLLKSCSDQCTIRVIGRKKEKLMEFEKKGCMMTIVDSWDVDTLTKSFKGIDRLWFTAPNPGPKDKAFDRTNLAKNVVDAAKKAGVSFLVFAGVLGSEHESTVFAKEFRDLERYIESSGIPYCGLRMAVFLENILLTKHDLQSGLFPQPIETDKKFTQVSVEDIGAFSAAVLAAGPKKFMNRYFNLTGGELRTTSQMADILTRILGKEIKAHNVAHKEFRKTLEAAKMPPYQIDGFFELYDDFRKGLCQTIDPIFKEIVGRDYIPMEKRISDMKHMGLL